MKVYCLFKIEQQRKFKLFNIRLPQKKPLQGVKNEFSSRNFHVANRIFSIDQEKALTYATHQETQEEASWHPLTLVAGAKECHEALLFVENRTTTKIQIV